MVNKSIEGASSVAIRGESGSYNSPVAVASVANECSYPG